MKFELKTVPLGEIITLKRGYDLPERLRKEGVVPIISSAGAIGTHNEAKVTAPGVVTGRYGTIGQIYFLNKNFWPLNTSLYVKDFKRNNPAYVYYLLHGVNFFSCVDKAAVPGVNRNHLEMLSINYYPDYEAQESIAKFLMKFEEASQIKAQTAKRLEGIARALYRSWFVDFEPTKAKAAALQARQDPQLAAMAAISGRTVAELQDLEPETHESLRQTADLFPDRLDPETKLPAGWELKELGELCNLNHRSLKNKNLPDEMVYLDIRNVKKGIVLGSKRLNKNFPSRARRKLKKGDTIISTVRPENHSYSYIGARLDSFIASTGFAVLTPRNQDLSTLVYLSCTQRENVERLMKIADGGAYPAVAGEDIVKQSVVFSNKANVEKFSHITQPIYDQIDLLHQQSQTLSELRDALLPKLLSGEITPGQARDITDEAMA